jgi:hypothetical protein
MARTRLPFTSTVQEVSYTTTVFYAYYRCVRKGPAFLSEPGRPMIESDKSL